MNTVKPTIHRNSEESGFTLVELLVVILIIGVLSAIAIPAFMNQREKANDAALHSDLRNAAMTVVSADLTQANKDGFFASAGYSIVEGEKGEHGFSSTRWKWNSSDKLPTINVSDYTVIEIYKIGSAGPGQLWEGDHNEGDFCLVGTSRGSQWDYVPNGGSVNSENGRSWQNMLFFDVKQNGIKTLEELVELYEAGADMSCERFGRRISNNRNNA